MLLIPRIKFVRIEINCSWNKEKLFDRYYSNSETLMAECGVNYFGVSAPPPLAAGIPVLCRICQDEFSLEETYGMGCGHHFCLDCWGHYLQDKGLCFLL